MDRFQKLLLGVSIYRYREAEDLLRAASESLTEAGAVAKGIGQEVDGLARRCAEAASLLQGELDD